MEDTKQSFDESFNRAETRRPDFVQIIINGEQRNVPDQLTIEGLIRHLSLPPDRLAVERNREVVRRAQWSETVLENDDRIEIIHFVGGGSSDSVAVSFEIGEV
jgi:thiamine biosynthesis protein ThiS